MVTPPHSPQGYGSVTVSALFGGSLTLPERFFVTPASADARCTVPSLCFLVQHTNAITQKVTRLVFDLGLRRDISTYSDPIRKHCATRQPMTTEPDVIASLAKGGLVASDIDYVILSHVHYDHIGTPADFTSPNTKFIVGPGALDLLNGKTDVNVGSHSFFEKDLLPTARTIELPHPPSANDTDMLTPQDSNRTLPPPPSSSNTHPTPNWTWTQTATFPHTIDFFNDGTLYIVNAPGHLQGHINLLARLSSSRSVYLAGDACHDMRLFSGSHEIATWTDDTGKTCCIHVDKAGAKKTIARIRDFQESESSGVEYGFGNVEVVFAHNWAWEREAREKGRFWPGVL